MISVKNLINKQFQSLKEKPGIVHVLCCSALVLGALSTLSISNAYADMKRPPANTGGGFQEDACPLDQEGLDALAALMQNAHVTDAKAFAAALHANPQACESALVPAASSNPNFIMAGRGIKQVVQACRTAAREAPGTFSWCMRKLCFWRRVPDGPSGGGPRTGGGGPKNGNPSSPEGPTTGGPKTGPSEPSSGGGGGGTTGHGGEGDGPGLEFSDEFDINETFWADDKGVIHNCGSTTGVFPYKRPVPSSCISVGEVGGPRVPSNPLDHCVVFDSNILDNLPDISPDTSGGTVILDVEALADYLQSLK